MPGIKFELSYSASDEARYVQRVVMQWEWYRANGYKPDESDQNVSIPSELRAQLSQGVRQFGLPQISQAIAKDVRPSMQLDDMRRDISRVEEMAQGYFEAFAVPASDVPERIIVQPTAYGPGGSYQPANGQRIARMIVRPDKPQFPFATTMVHETTHILLENNVVRYSLGETGSAAHHAKKEALIDKCCGCNELKPLISSYQPQKRFEQALVENWRDILPVRFPNALTWA